MWNVIQNADYLSLAYAGLLSNIASLQTVTLNYKKYFWSGPLKKYRPFWSAFNVSKCQHGFKRDRPK